MDYRGWLKRACEFVAEFERRNPEMKAFQDVGTPSSNLELSDLESAIGRALPTALRDYLLTASRDAEFHYWWEGASEVPEFGTKTVAGGLEAFCVARYIERDFAHCQELAEDFHRAVSFASVCTSSRYRCQLHHSGSVVLSVETLL